VAACFRNTYIRARSLLYAEAPRLSGARSPPEYDRCSAFQIGAVGALESLCGNYNSRPVIV
jgi:hypothetical protein